MAGKSKLTLGQLNEMCRLRERNWSYRRIADHFTESGMPISERGVAYQCARMGAEVPVQFRHNPPARQSPYTRGGVKVRPWSSDEDEILRSMEQQGKGPSEIGRRVGRTPSSVRGRLISLARREEWEDGQ